MREIPVCRERNIAIGSDYFFPTERSVWCSLSSSVICVLEAVFLVSASAAALYDSTGHTTRTEAASCHRHKQFADRSFENEEIKLEK